MVLMDLFKTQTVGQRYIACLSKLSLQIVADDNICFLPRAVLSHSQIVGARQLWADQPSVQFAVET